jgi:hypothetical protein
MGLSVSKGKEKSAVGSMETNTLNSTLGFDPAMKPTASDGHRVIGSWNHPHKKGAEQRDWRRKVWGSAGGPGLFMIESETARKIFTAQHFKNEGHQPCVFAHVYTEDGGGASQPPKFVRFFTAQVCFEKQSNGSEIMYLVLKGPETALSPPPLDYTVRRAPSLLPSQCHLSCWRVPH